MTLLEALFLGIVQGLTEFLPVSSSGHLELTQYFLGFEHLDRYILFSLVCHLGTLCAIFYVLFPQVKACLSNKSKAWQVILGTLPLFPLVLILKPIKSLFDKPEYLGYCFLVTAVLIFISALYKFRPQKTDSESSTKDSITIGLFQAIAVLPGISRSGATISAARLLGWQKEEAITYSFLLAIPAILGGTFLEILQLFKLPQEQIAFISPLHFFVGFFTSFFIGCLALRFLIRMGTQDKWIYFAWYCLGIGLFTTVYFNFFI